MAQLVPSFSFLPFSLHPSPPLPLAPLLLLSPVVHVPWSIFSPLVEESYIFSNDINSLQHTLTSGHERERERESERERERERGREREREEAEGVRKRDLSEIE